MKIDEILRKIHHLDKRIIDISMIAIISFALLVPMAIPVSISPMTRKFYDTIGAVPDGSTVVIVFGLSMAGMYELGPFVASMLNQLFAKKVHVVLTHIKYAESPASLNVVFDKGWSRLPSDQTYGKDWVNLGFLAGDEIGLASMAKNLRGSFGKDTRGTPIDQLPIMDKLVTWRDWDLTIYCGWDMTTVEAFIRQFFGARKLIYISISMVAYAMPYYPDQAAAILGGTKPAAEYELPLGHPGPGLKSTNVLSLSQILIVAFILIGNLAYFALKYRETSDKSEVEK